jgi:broad specificity phosphatase PhoE
MAFPRREPIVRRDLRCLDFGELEGRTYSEVRRDHPGLAETWEKDLPSLAFPGGESMVGFQARVTRAWHEILSLHAGAGDDVALVLHGGPLRIIIFDILGIPLKNFYKLHVPTASVSIVEAASDFCTVVSLGVRAPGQLPH